MTKTVVGLYRDFETAERVVRELTSAGIPRDDISLVAHDRKESGMMDSQGKGNDEGVGDGMATGAGTGAVLGGLGGLLVGLGALAIPGVGPIIAAGPLAAALAGAGVGAVAGGLVGALVDAGVPEEDAHSYSTGIERGGTLLTVRAQDQMAQQAATIMNRYNPINIRQPGWESTSFANRQEQTYSDTTFDTDRQGGMAMGRQSKESDFMDRDANRYQGESSTQHLDEGEAHLPIVEEEIRVGKREVERGSMRIEKDVIEEPFEETHTVRSERVNIERRDVDRPLTGMDADAAFRDESFEVTEKGEELIVDKQARVTGEVIVRKDFEEHPETVRGTTRRTEIHTEDADMGTTRSSNWGSSDWDTYSGDFRNHYQTSFSRGGHDFSYYEPAYRYGSTLGDNESYRGRQWNDIEMDARSNWELEHSDSRWDDVKDAIRHGWEKVSGGR